MNNGNSNLLQREARMMKLEKLIAERERISTQPFPIAVKELLARYEQLYTGAISDVLREFWPDICRAFRKHEPDRMKRIEDRLPKSIMKAADAAAEQ
jgi:hypothetical protein